MQLLDQILERLLAPLLFAGGNNFARLALVKKLETAVSTLSLQLQQETAREVHGDQRKDLMALIQHLSDLFSQYDNLELSEKKSRITKAIRCISDIKALLTCHKADRILAKGSMPGDDAEKTISLLVATIRDARGIGPKIANLLSSKDILTIEDLLYFLPRNYQDRRKIQAISDTVPEVIQTVVGRITLSGMRYFGRRKIFEVTIKDEHGTLKAKWFKGREAYLKGTFKTGRRLILTGMVGGFPFDREMIHPDYEIIDENDDQSLHFKRIVPVYSETEGVAQKTFRRIMWQALRDYGGAICSPIPREILSIRKLPDIRQALRQVHFPSDEEDIKPYLEATSDAHRRLIYEEFFFFQLALGMAKEVHHCEPSISFRTSEEILNRFFGLLPFVLTAAQRRVIAEIMQDMGSSRRMYRLLQGDVGSGKTIVSVAAMIMACSNGYQAVLMAPTEILAEQHYQTLKRWADHFGLRVSLITRNATIHERREISADLETGAINIAVGTHALIQQWVIFGKLGLVVIDEQHRFGVLQRSQLLNKGLRADILVMTATPIPRTLAMTVYGDLDLSLIDEMPPKRISIQTRVFSEGQRQRLYEIIRKEVRRNRQVFMVYPLIEASESVDLRDAARMAAQLKEEVFPDYRVELIHGRMKKIEKEAIMAAFGSGKIRILVATTLIEVGIDIPAASLMVIEHAERFGLSQLHQLRGRVGRGDIPSSCILMTYGNTSDKALQRLRIMEETNDGFRIAEADLAIRGPGELMGTRQSGLPEFRVADIRRDSVLLSEARQDAFSLIQKDPFLEIPGHRELRKEIYRRWGKTIALAKLKGQ